MSPRATENLGITDSVSWRLGKVTEKPISKRRGDRRRSIIEHLGVRGLVVVRLFGPDGQLKALEAGHNLVTDYGDEHIGERIYDDTALIVTGMRLGTGVIAASKAGAGSFIGTYISTSNEDLDAVPIGVDKGADLGWRVPHICTWIAGDITNGAISETALSDETPLTDVQGTAANTVARFVFAATIDKQAGDSLEVTWNLDTLGA